MVMTFEKFEHIMKQIQAYESKRDRISDFLEKEICTDSYCLFNVGEELVTTITSMLADYFNCWYNIKLNGNCEIKEDTSIDFQSLADIIENKENFREDSETPIWWNSKYKRWDNDIEYWLYEDNKKITIDGKEIPIGTLRELYDYLVNYCIDKKEI